MDLRDGEEARLVVAVGRALQRAGLHTKILGYDHNWSLHSNDGGPPDDPANPEYAASLLSNPAASRYLAGTAFHCYAGDPGTPVGSARPLPAEVRLLPRVLGL
jgi:glucosylceramidase